MSSRNRSNILLPSKKHRSETSNKSVRPVYYDKALGQIPSDDTLNNFDAFSVNNDVDEDVKIQLASLARINDKMLKDPKKPTRGKYLNLENVQMMMYICDQFGVDANVKYPALEMFNKFMINFGDELRLYSKDQQKYQLENLENSYLLKMCSCIQAASKNFGLLLEIVQVGNIGELLEQMHPTRGYSVQEICDSEYLVLSKLSFNLICLNPMHIIESILALLKLPREMYKTTYGKCLCLLDFFYLERTNIFSEFLETIRRDTLVQPRLRFSTYPGDYILVSAGIIQCSLSSSCNQNDPNAYLPDIETLVEIPREEIVTLADTFAKLITLDHSDGDGDISSCFTKCSITGSQMDT